RVRVRRMDTPETVRAKAERAPVRLPGGERVTRDRIRARIEAAYGASEALRAATDPDRLRDEIEQVDSRRNDYTFWNDPDEAGRVLAQQTRRLETVARIERLQDSLNQMETELALGASRADDLKRLAIGLSQLEWALAVAHRELVAMGRDGYWDALMEIVPIGQSSDARNFLFD